MRLPTHGPHVFVDPAAITVDTAELDDDDGHHLTRALRRGEGDAVSVADGAGTVWQARIARTGPPVLVTLEQRYDVPAPDPPLWVVHALPTGRKLDEVVRRLCELGVDRVEPAVSARCENRPPSAKAAKARQRWRAVARAAAKQARRARPVEVAEVVAWPGSLAHHTAGAVLWEQAEHPLGATLGATVPVGRGAPVVLGIGPEGGLTAEEVQAAATPAATLGPTILRTETASVAAAAIALERLGRLG